jgi:hypothetical protein
MGKMRTTTKHPEKSQPDSATEHTQEVVDAILARLTQLQPLQDARQDDKEQPGSLAREVIRSFRENVAKAIKSSEPKA